MSHSVAKLVTVPARRLTGRPQARDGAGHGPRLPGPSRARRGPARAPLPVTSHGPGASHGAPLARIRGGSGPAGGGRGSGRCGVAQALPPSWPQSPVQGSSIL